MREVAPLISLMRDVGSAHGGKTPAQARSYVDSPSNCRRTDSGAPSASLLLHGCGHRMHWCFAFFSLCQAPAQVHMRPAQETKAQAMHARRVRQVAINWTLCKGAVPIPGAKNAKQAREAAGALGWRLTGDEVTCCA